MLIVVDVRIFVNLMFNEISKVQSGTFAVYISLHVFGGSVWIL